VPKSVLRSPDSYYKQSSSADDGLDRHWIAPADRRRSARGYAFQWFSLSALLGVIVLGLSCACFGAGPPPARGVNAITAQ